MSEISERLTGQSSSIDLREARLQEIRREAERTGTVTLRKDGHDRTPLAAVAPETGYYGLPLLKEPQWKKQIPLYFFCGGAAGAAAIIAGVSRLTHADERLIRDANYLAAIGGAVSPALLISDLGVPSRFLYMMRVIKFQSPMSVGSWTLMAFSASSAAAAFLAAWQKRGAIPIAFLRNSSQFLSALTGAVLATYTGVLLGATAIPVWNQNIKMLPPHFAASGISAAAALLELRGNQSAALNTIGIAAALSESAFGASIEMRRNPALKPLKSGRSGFLARIGGLLSGPVPLILRLLSLRADNQRKIRLRKIAAASAVAGSLATRFAWTDAGSASAKDTQLLLDA